ncbi:MAG: hypothetical protein F6J87_01435 [Spirulina sp. SIO3F2]|nr:hypothetical protein [Spirulina sp. SIO3F2]
MIRPDLSVFQLVRSKRLLRPESLLLISLWFVWLVSSLIYLLSPFSSAVGSNYSIILGWFYVLSFTLGSLVLSKLFLQPAAKLNIAKLKSFRSSRYAWLASGASLIGMFCHVYDKAVVRGYDYSGCLAAVREAWVTEARRLGPSSIFSALGHIGAGFAVPVLIYVMLVIITDQRFMPVFQRMLLAAIGFLTLLIYAVVVVSRSALVIALVVVLAAGLLAIVEKFRARTAAVFLLMLALVCSFASFTFAQRIQCIGDDVYAVENYFHDLDIGYYNSSSLNKSTLLIPDSQRQSYFYKSITFLQKGLGDIKKHVQLQSNSDLEPDQQSRWRAVWESIAVYANHGHSNFENTFYKAKSERTGTALGGAYCTISTRLSLPTLPVCTEPKNTGKGLISLPGAVWYNFGFIGLLFFPLFHACITVFAVKLMSRQAGLSIALGMLLFTLSGATAIFSPLGVVWGPMSFPFLAFAFLCLWILPETFELLRLRIRKNI